MNTIKLKLFAPKTYFDDSEDGKKYEVKEITGASKVVTSSNTYRVGDVLTQNELDRLSSYLNTAEYGEWKLKVSS